MFTFQPVLSTHIPTGICSHSCTCCSLSWVTRGFWRSPSASFWALSCTILHSSEVRRVFNTLWTSPQVRLQITRGKKKRLKQCFLSPWGRLCKLAFFQINSKLQKKSGPRSIPPTLHSCPQEELALSDVPPPEFGWLSSPIRCPGGFDWQQAILLFTKIKQNRFLSFPVGLYIFLAQVYSDTT